MQPPTFNFSSLRTQLAHLKHAALHPTLAKQTNQPEKLICQINAWIASMTPEQRMRRFSIEEIERLAGLTGKNGGRTAHHHIAMALRKSGLTPSRDWTVAGRNRRFWKYEGIQ